MSAGSAGASVAQNLTNPANRTKVERGFSLVVRKLQQNPPFMQMGYTRARRYANYKGGKKYDKLADGFALKGRGTGDPEKAESAAIFYEFWKKAGAEPGYAAQEKLWKGRYG